MYLYIKFQLNCFFTLSWNISAKWIFCFKSTCVCFNEIMWLIIMKMRLKIQNGSHRYGINRSRYNFHFQPNIDVETTLMLSLFIGVASTLKQQLNSIETTLLIFAVLITRKWLKNKTKFSSIKHLFLFLKSIIKL